MNFIILKSIDALDTWEDMSDLGVYLINMPIELNLAKMIIFSLVLKCLDPIVTIACGISVGEPCRKFNEMNGGPEFADHLYSDHIALYKIFTVIL